MTAAITTPQLLVVLLIAALWLGLGVLIVEDIGRLILQQVSEEDSEVAVASGAGRPPRTAGAPFDWNNMGEYGDAA